MTDAQLSALSEVSRLLEEWAIDYWLFGGWAVDFYVGAVTRPHFDVDLAVWLADVPRIEALLTAPVGAAGVVGGIAAARLVARNFTFAGLMGGAMGGLLVGAFGELIGHDAFLLLFGKAPGDITGALEGLLLGSAVGLADDLGRRFAADGGIQRKALLAAAIGALAGLLIAVSGGQLLGGSLALLVETFPDARLHLDPLGTLLGPVAARVTSALEGAWFSLCLVGALMLARR